MPRLSPCPVCGNHVIVGSRHCPHCEAAFGPTGAPLSLGPAALVLGLVLTATAACPATPKYGDTGDPCSDEEWYADSDGDGYGDPATLQTGGCGPVGLVSDGTDCDDTDADIHPDATETAGDGVDANCDTRDDP